MEKTILVVEDDADFRDMLALIFKGQGYAVYTADDGCEAIKLVAGACPDVIITDISMPNMDGLEIVRLLRKRPEYDKVYILVVSACYRDNTDEAITAGADQIMYKPVSSNLLIGAINRVFE